MILKKFAGYSVLNLVNSQDQTTIDEPSGALDFINFKVPALFKCKAGDPAVEKACSQVVTVGGVLPCWISRPYVSFSNRLTTTRHHIYGHCLLGLFETSIPPRSNDTKRDAGLVWSRRLGEMHVSINVSAVHNLIYDNYIAAYSCLVILETLLSTGKNDTDSVYELAKCNLFPA